MTKSRKKQKDTILLNDVNETPVVLDVNKEEFKESSLEETIKILTEEKTKLQKALDEANKLNSELKCLTLKLDNYLLTIQSNYVKDGRWVSLGIVDFITFGKLTFTFVKSTLSDCFNVKFDNRLPTWVSKTLDFFVKWF